MQMVAQQPFAAESEFLDQRNRCGIVRMHESLRAMQAEFAKAEVEHRRDRLGGDALPLASRVNQVADVHALTADVAVIVGD